MDENKEMPPVRINVLFGNQLHSETYHLLFAKSRCGSLDTACSSKYLIVNLAVRREYSLLVSVLSNMRAHLPKSPNTAVPRVKYLRVNLLSMPMHKKYNTIMRKIVKQNSKYSTQMFNFRETK